ARGQIDRHPHVQSELAPTRGLAQGRVDDVQRDRADERGLLDERDELQRRQQAVFGVAPAKQRLDTGYPPRLEVDLRLVVENELVALQRGADLTEQPQSRGIEAVLLGRVDLHTAVVGLGARKREISSLEQGVEIVRVLPHD